MNFARHQRWIVTALLMGAVPPLSVRGEEPLVEVLVLQESAGIQLEGGKERTFEALKIKEDLSMRLQNCSNVVITGCDLHSIELLECQHVIIRNCWVHDSKRCGVRTWQCTDLLVEGCRMENVSSGVYAVDSRDIRVEGNFVRNVSGPFPRGQMAQFDNVTGRKNAIRGNYAINEAGKSCPEDVINVYQSSGESGAPILIENNYLCGDPVKGSAGKSKTGSGIMLADKGGAHQLCRHNVILSAGQVGIGVAGGTFIQVEDNFIFGTRSGVANVGLYAWNQSELPSHDVGVTHNRVSWMNHDGESSDWWNGGGISAVRETANHFGDEHLAKEVPPPPSHAPMPPSPFLRTDSEGRKVARLPWKP